MRLITYMVTSLNFYLSGVFVANGMALEAMPAFFSACFLLTELIDVAYDTTNL